MTATTDPPGRPFDVTPDGERLLVIQDDSSFLPELRLVTGFDEELRASVEKRD